MLVLKDVTAHYGTSQALFGMSLDLQAGQVATLLGRNGMGKTTTINTIMGIVKASGGSITFDGQELVGRASFRTANLGLGLVPEGRQIFPNLTMLENLVATASNHLGVDDPWTVEKVLALFPELETRTGSMGNLLSGGEQQMLAIGRALMTNPRLLILDEATEGLAPIIRQEIWAAIARLKQETGTAILLIDKSVRELAQVSDRAVILGRGETVWSGAFADITPEVSETYVGV